MSKFARGRSWIEHRLADSLDIDGIEYRVDLVARRGTGVQGFRVTVVYLPRQDGGAEREVESAPAGSIADVHRRARELEGNETVLRELFEEGVRA